VADAGLVDIETRRIDVQRSFVDSRILDSRHAGATLAPLFKSMAPEDVARIKTGVRAHLGQDDAGDYLWAWANAIKGRVPG